MSILVGNEVFSREVEDRTEAKAPILCGADKPRGARVLRPGVNLARLAGASAGSNEMPDDRSHHTAQATPRTDAARLSPEVAPASAGRALMRCRGGRRGHDLRPGSHDPRGSAAVEMPGAEAASSPTSPTMAQLQAVSTRPASTAHWTSRSPPRRSDAARCCTSPTVPLDSRSANLLGTAHTIKHAASV